MSFDASRFDKARFCAAFGLHDDEVTVTDTGPSVTIRDDWTEERLTDIVDRFHAMGVRFGPCTSMGGDGIVSDVLYPGESSGWAVEFP